MGVKPQPDTIPLANPLRPPMNYEPRIIMREVEHPRRVGEWQMWYDVYDTCHPDEPRMEEYPWEFHSYQYALDELLQCRMRMVRRVRDRMLDDLANLNQYHRATYGWSL